MTLTRRSSLTIATGVIGAGVVGFLGWRRISPPPAPLPMHAAAAATPTQEGDQRRTERTLGDPAAKVTVQEFFSLTCSHCAAFAKGTMPQIEKDLIEPGKVRFVFHDFPLDQVALTAAMVARYLPPTQYYPFVSALFANMFDDHTIEWLNKRGYLRWDRRGQGEAIIAAVNAVIARHR